MAGIDRQVLKPIAAQAVTASTPVTVWTPATGKSYRIEGYALSLSVAGSVIVKNKNGNNAATETFRTPLLAAGVGIVDKLGEGIVPGVANDILQIDVTGSGSVSGYIYGAEE